MTKEDYMRLPKERLAELLAEIDWQVHKRYTYLAPSPCYSKDGVCTNPYHDCVNCPRQFGSGGHFTTTTGVELKDEKL